MRLGFHTNAFVWAGVNDIKEIADFALETGFDFLEVGPGIELNQPAFEDIRKTGLSFDAFIYCRNFIDDDSIASKRERDELYCRMEFAASVGAEKMVCSTGISRKLSLPLSGGCNPLASLSPVLDFLNEALELAEKNGLELCLENCPMYRNIATSPLMWRSIFSQFAGRPLFLCYDPGHFVWQMIDVYKPFHEFPNLIRHMHLKDTTLDRAKLDDVGILHNTGSEKGFEENQWWRHSVIGDGEIDWDRFMKLVNGLPAEPTLSFEMEDYRYECDPTLVREGYRLQYTRLQAIQSKFMAQA